MREFSSIIINFFRKEFMKNFRFLMTAAVVTVVAAGLTGCNKGEEFKSNYQIYQEAVDNAVSAEKKHDNVILLVAFGSTWDQAFKTFDATKEAYRQKFPDYDIYLSYSSAICINRAAAGENTDPRNYYAPNFWLHAFGTAQYKNIVVQSLQVIPGEEYARVINYMKDFANNHTGDIDDKYLSEVELRLGVPLLQDSEEDVKEVAKRLNLLYKDKAAEGVVAFMGHGNPDSYDTYKANIRYTELEEALQAHSKNYFVGTVDMMGNFKTNVLKRMIEAGINSGKVFCHPLMSIDGDHGHNDMAGNDCPEGVEKFSDLEENEEGEVEDCSWKVYFNLAGYECNNNTMIDKGLLELPSIREIWMNHTQDAINGEPLDFYHSMYPEAE